MHISIFITAAIFCIALLLGYLSQRKKKKIEPPIVDPIIVQEYPLFDCIVSQQYSEMCSTSSIYIHKLLGMDPTFENNRFFIDQDGVFNNFEQGVEIYVGYMDYYCLTRKTEFNRVEVIGDFIKCEIN